MYVLLVMLTGLVLQAKLSHNLFQGKWGVGRNLERGMREFGQ